jgi:16S rRNA (uracil1498-N3)-methyltransferase
LIAISLIKNRDRFEWFLEKATEIGVTAIIPLICERTEKEKFRFDRMQGICISAMLQSQQVWLPVLHEPIPFKQVIEEAKQEQKFIAHCMPGEKGNLAGLVNKELSSRIILIGPEGDFTREEADLAIQYQFSPVALGETRLRSETAGVVAATILCIS